MNNNNKITARSEDYSKWYLDVIEAADLAEYGPVKGTMIIKPYGYAIWENIKNALDKKIKSTGHQNMYFPLLIPKSFFNKEASHVEGFAKECAVVTHYRLKNDGQGNIVVDESAKLEEELIIRPTSETIINNSFAQWVKSWRDLPVLINQWANVMRWEMRTRPFLRTSEFLWQEGHTCHISKSEAEKEAKKMLRVYVDLVKNKLAMDVVSGKKSDSEKFAGALHTYTIEAMMQDGKALQSGTSHNLGQNFAKAFDIKFLDKENNFQYVWQTSWGMSTRIIGGLIMTHSDDKGLVLPPEIAPIKVVVIPILKEKEDNTEVLNFVKKLKLGVRESEIDTRNNISTGVKYNEWEKKGVPIRLEVGQREMDNNSVMLVCRHNSSKTLVKINDLAKTIKHELKDMQAELYQKALDFRIQHTKTVDTWEEFVKEIDNNNFVLAHWDGTAETENKIKEETKGTIRCLPFDQKIEKGFCVYSKKPSKQRVLFAKAY
ncbi:MAG: proline--tRNA ligase [Patescibacteria group bacterium]